jgi:hypothetical protein
MSLRFELNGSNADKLPFSIWIFVEVATCLSSVLCARSGHVNIHICVLMKAFEAD